MKDYYNNIDKLAEDFQKELVFSILEPIAKEAFEAGHTKKDFTRWWNKWKKAAREVDQSEKEKGEPFTKSKFKQRLEEAMELNKKP